MQFQSIISRLALVLMGSICSFFITQPVAAQNYALSFDGVDDYVQIADNALLSGGAGKSLTLEAWVKPSSVSGTRPIVHKYLDGNTKEWGIAIYNGAVEAAIESSNDNWEISGGSVAAGVWTHLALVFDNNANLVTLYVNGVQANQKALTKDMPDTNAPIRIGRHGYSTDYFSGQIEEVRIWNTVRSAAQITAAMNGQLLGNESGLIGYWAFNQGSGQSAEDGTINNNDGVLGNTASSDAADPAWLTSTAPLGSVAPTLILSSPNGAESWEAGTVNPINWSSQGSIANVKLEYSTNNGASWTTIISSTPNNGTYSWAVPNSPTSQALVRLSDAADNDPQDVSNSVFSITAASGNSYALSFDGVNDMAVIPDNALLSGGVGKSITVEAWVNMQDVSAEHNPIVAKYHDGAYKDWGLDIEAGMLNVNIESTDEWSCQAGLVPLNKWTHLAFTFDNAADIVRLYVNGFEAGTGFTLTKDMPNTAAEIWFGAHSYDSLFRTFGTIDEVRIWNYARSITELQSAMNLKLTGSESGLLGYWPFDDGSGQTAADLTGHGNNARLGVSASADTSDPTWVTSLARNTLPMPTIATFSPTSGDEGIIVTISGTNFNGATEVAFNGTLATSFSVDSDTQIRATVPIGASTGRVRVTNANGFGFSTTDFTLVIPPGTFKFTPQHDTYTRASTPTSTNGSAGTLRLEKDAFNSYLKFNVTGLDNTAWLAKLRFYVVNTSSDGGSAHLISNNLADNTTTWTQGNLNWENAPLIDSSVLSTLGTVTVGELVEFNVTGAISGNGIYSFGLKNSTSDRAYYSSKEGTVAPVLVIKTLTNPPASLQLTSPNGSESWTVASSQNIRWGSPGNFANVKLEFSTNNGASWTTIVASTPNDGSYSWTVPSTVSSQCLVRASDAADGNPSDVSDAVFSIITPSSPTVTLTSPNGGENLVVGNSHNITWTSTGGLGNVKLEYSIDNGSNWTAIIISTTNTGSYAWTVPNSPTGQALVRVSDAADNDPQDVSNSTFSITITSANQYALLFDGVDDYVEIPDNALLSGGAGKSLTLEAWVKPSSVSGTRPIVHKYLDGNTKEWGIAIFNGAVEAAIESSNDNWQISGGSVSASVWTHIALVFDNSANLVTLYVNGVQAAQTSLTKDMPDTNAPIRIGRHGYSTDYFSGEIEEVRVWNTARTAAQVSAAMSAELLGNESGLIGYWAFNQGSGQTAEDGTINNNDGRLGSAAISDTADPIWVSSTAPVGSTASTLTLSSPNGGESWDVGSVHAITWGWLGSISNVKLEYSTNNGTSWITIVSSTANDGNHGWTVPNAVSNQCLVRVSDASDGNPSDQSNAPFSIIASSATVTLTSPNGGESWTAGSNQNITWSSTGTLANVKLEYSTTNGASWTTIIASTANDGSQGWTIPDSPSSQSLVRVSDAVDGDPFDASDGVFTIVFVPAVPAITSFTPANGVIGTEVTIVGNNLTGASDLKFSTASASSFTVDSATQIRANVPSGATSGPISVTTGGGTAQSTDDFVVIASSTTIFNPIHDTWLRFTTPTSTANGTSVTLRARVTTTPDTLKSYLKFDVIGLSGSVLSAKLRLNATGGSSDGGSLYVVSNNFFGTSTPWTENATNWNNAPLISGTPLGSAGAVDSSQWAEFDVTAAISGNETFSFGLMNHSANDVLYHSKETATPTLKPELVIQTSGGGGPAVPSITSFTPSSGVVGVEVTITGSNLSGASEVKFNTTTASTFTVDSATQIRANVAAGATSGKISVTTGGGTAQSAADFTVTIPPAAPSITSFTPSSGVVGVEVTITGSNLSGASEVKFNTTTASTFTVDSATQIRANVPAGATSGKISVTTGGGTAESATDFTVSVPPATPSITSFTPSSGVVGIEVTISGSNLSGASEVKFNTTSASTFTVDSATQIRANVPAGATSGKISVTTGGGTAESATDFTVSVPPAAPSIASFTPSSGVVGVEVTITGSNLSGASEVKFNTTVASTFTVDTETQIRANVPAGATSGKIDVTTGGGTAQSVTDFTVTSGGATVTLTYTPLYDTYVRLSTPTTNYGSVSTLRARKTGSEDIDSYLKFDVTEIAGAVQSAKLRLKVTSESVDGGWLYAVSNNYKNTTTPWTQTGINWNNAPGMSGSVLASAGAVAIGAVIEFDVTAVITANSIYSFGLTNNSSDDVNYSSQEGATKPELIIQVGSGTPAAPTISSFTPTSGIVGAEVTITGSNLSGASEVKFNTTTASTFTIDSATQIRANVPTGATSGKINVTTGGGTATSAADFTVTTPPSAPTITSFTPTSGIVGSEVIITGSNLSDASEVKFNTTTASTYTVDSATQIRAIVPSGAATGKISVTTGGGTAQSATDFTVSSGGTPVTLSFTPLHDTYVRLTTPTSNYGAVTTLRLRKTSNEDFDSYLKFDVTGITGAVQSAKLRLKVTNASVDGGSLYAVSNNYKNTTTPWIQSGMNWNNAPGMSGSVLSSVAAVAVGNVVEFDVTAAISGNGIYSFGMSNNSTDDVNYSSQEGATKPELVIQVGSGSPAVPAITSFTPSSGAVGVEVTITGSNFSGASDVKFNTTTASTFTVDSATQIRANVPSGAITGKISVTTGGGTAISAADFTVTTPPAAPTITSFTPTSGIVGTEVTITGSNFSGASNVKFNTTTASTFTVDSATQIRANVPSGATTGKISVTTGGGTAQSATNFTVSGGTPVTLNFTPLYDTYVRLSTPTTNYGTISTLRLRKTSSEDFDSYLKFDVTGITGAVQSAKLRLKVTNASVDGGSLYAVSNNYKSTTTPWTESGMNWNNAPGMSGSALGSVAAVAVGDVVEFDVTAAITGNGIFSFGLTNNSSDDVNYSSQEGATHPELVIQASSATVARRDDFSDEPEAAALPDAYGLSPNYPNPFNGQTTIAYALPEAATVRLVIYNTLGQVVRKLVDETQSAGYKSATWDGTDDHGRVVGSGIYFYRLDAGNHRLNRRMMLQQ